jgi:hypothetical protein
MYKHLHAGKKGNKCDLHCSITPAISYGILGMGIGLVHLGKNARVWCQIWDFLKNVVNTTCF